MNIYQKLRSVGALLLISYSPQKDLEKAAAQNVLHKVYRELDRIEAEIYLSEGFQFSPGGGYWFFPREMETLTEEQRREIQERINLKMTPLSQLERAIEEVEKN